MKQNLQQQNEIVLRQLEDKLLTEYYVWYRTPERDRL